MVSIKRKQKAEQGYIAYLCSVFLCAGQILLGSVLLATSPMPGVRLPQKVVNFLKDSNLHYKNGDLIKALQRLKSQKEALYSADSLRTLSIKVPVIVGKFANTGEDEWPIQELQKELFDGPWPTGTMRDYYLEVSYGQFEIKGTVYGWYQVSHDDTYYEGNQTKPYDNGFIPPPRGIGGFLKEILDLADPDIDFGQFDNDGPDGIPNSGDDSGVVDALIVVHAGGGGEYGGPEIWSHRSKYSAWWNSPYTTNDPSANGGYIRIEDYTVQPAISSDGRMIEIGVFCHEFGHILGLPDLYDLDESSEGIGHWGLMGSGNWNQPSSPAHMCAWSKEQLGWISPVVLYENMVEVNIPEVEFVPTVYKLWKGGNIQPYPSQYGNHLQVGREYFLIENRQPLGFDKYLHGGGLLIWHVDNSVLTQNDDEDHPLVDLEEADGAMSGRGDSGDPFPGISGNRNFDYWTTPNSRDYNGDNSEVAVLNISDPSPSMRADLEVLELRPQVFYVDHRVTEVSGNNNGEPEPSEKIELVVTLLNYGADMTQVRGAISTNDPSISFSVGNASFADIPFGCSGDNSADPFVFTVAETASVHWTYFNLDVISNDGAYTSRISFRQLIGHPEILLVDDDYEGTPRDQDVDRYYTTALDSIGEFYRYWDYKTQGTLDSQRLEDYEIVIWFTGSAVPTLIIEDQENLKDFLDGGGNLLISSQDLGDLALSPASRDFYHNYLHADFIGNYTSEYNYIFGIKGDPISHELRFIYNTPFGAQNQTNPDIIAPRNGASPVFVYPQNQQVAGIRYSGKHKLVYLAFGFEALADFNLDGPGARANLMRRILDWLRSPSGVEFAQANDLTKYVLEQNYPNPFNSQTTIKYHLPTGGRIVLRIYNLMGQEVRTLVNGKEGPGTFTTSWNGKDARGRDVPSGVYIYRMVAGGFTQSRKLILMR